jgi:hypothetical protein
MRRQIQVESVTDYLTCRGELNRLDYRRSNLPAYPVSAPGTRRRGDERSVRGQLVAVKRYTFARIRFFRSSSFTSFARA